MGDVVQLREACFQSFPARKIEFQKRRQEYRDVRGILWHPIRFSRPLTPSMLQETLALYATCAPSDLPHLINRLSHLLLWDPNSVTLRIRRGIALYRLRSLSLSLADLTSAVTLSTTSTTGEPNSHAPDFDALRFRALVLEELHDTPGVLRDVTMVLKDSPHDILALSLRAALRGNEGDLVGAQADLMSTNEAIMGEKVYRSRLGDSDCDLEYMARGVAYMSVSCER